MFDPKKKIMNRWWVANLLPRAMCFFSNICQFWLLSR